MTILETDEFPWQDTKDVVAERHSGPDFETKADSLDKDKRTFDVVMTSKRLDLSNEIVEPKAFLETIGAFKSNPIVLFNHSIWSEPPIGQVLPSSIEISDSKITGTVKMRPAGRSELTDRVWNAIEDGVLRKCSIGFRIREAEGGGYDDKGNRKPFVIKKADLVDLSIVNAPMNPDAEIKTQWKRLEGHLKFLEMTSFANGEDIERVKFVQPLDIDVIKRAAVIARRHFDKATKGTADAAELDLLETLYRELATGFVALDKKKEEPKQGDLEAIASGIDRALTALRDL